MPDRESAGRRLEVEMPALSMDEGMRSYIRTIRRAPMLTREEEQSYARRYRENGDTLSYERLTGSHLKLVASIASQFTKYGARFDDLVAEGNIGLIEAVNRFDPDRGFRLSTYAMWWIKAQIQEHLLRSWSLVRHPSSAEYRRVFFGLRRAKARIGALSDGDMTREHVVALAGRFGVSEDLVVHVNRRLSSDTSLNAKIGDDDGSVEMIDTLRDDGENQEDILIRTDERDNAGRMIGEALCVLNEREREIFSSRRLVEDPPTLEDLSKVWGVSRERIRQIEATALGKVSARVLDLRRKRDSRLINHDRDQSQLVVVSEPSLP